MPTVGQRMTKNKISSGNDTKRMKVIRRLKRIVEASRELISSLLFPLRCPICDEILSPEENEKGIHLACENKLYPVKGAVCMHCGRPLGYMKSQKQLKKQNIEYSGKKQYDAYVIEPDMTPSHLTLESTYEYCFECHRKGYTKSSNITQGKALYLYKGAIKNSMYRLKYANKREYARFYAKQAVKKYGTWLDMTLAGNITMPAYATCESSSIIPPSATPVTSAIIPVPVHPRKKRLRGYNQAEVFAEELSKLTGIPVDKECVRRVKDTAPQKELNYQERKNNLENAFQKGKSIVQYSHVLVVDDIYTTGCTAEAVAKELRKQGVRHIYLLSVCIGGND